MERLFYKKKTSILIVAATVVLIFLLCILMTFLAQLPNLNASIKTLTEMVEDAKKDEDAKQRLLEYRETNQYVIEWAIKMNMIPDDVINYIQDMDK